MHGVVSVVGTSPRYIQARHTTNGARIHPLQPIAKSKANTDRCHRMHFHLVQAEHLLFFQVVYFHVHVRVLPFLVVLAFARLLHVNDIPK